MSSNLMTTEPGGEQTQYESQHTTQDLRKKSGGQLGHGETTANPSQTTDAAQRLADKGENTAENIRYGQNISEHGMGGTTVGQTGQANSAEATRSEGVTAREAQGHGPGDNVGA